MAIDQNWLEVRYIKDLAHVTDIAIEAGCSSHNIRRLLRKWGLRRGSQAIKGRPSWNSGLTKDTDERVRELSEARKGEGNPMFKRPAWNVGLSKESDPRVASTALKLTGRLISDETRALQAAAKMGLRGAETNRFAGGVAVWPNGYEVTRVDGTYEYTHRLVAARSVGRALESREDVHHFDGDKLNNTPLNLVVLRDADHTRLHCYTKGLNRDEQITWLTNRGVEFTLVGES